ncbi:hypothetical protein GRJ2_003474700 [Grus japonensis]|uniref:ribonuclease H n=1 Tax=Grus japonensis TaxID=30415 RepID=A0ABC9YJ50_GRUJA
MEVEVPVSEHKSIIIVTPPHLIDNQTHFCSPAASHSGLKDKHVSLDHEVDKEIRYLDEVLEANCCDSTADNTSNGISSLEPSAITALDSSRASVNYINDSVANKRKENVANRQIPSDAEQNETSMTAEKLKSKASNPGKLTCHLIEGCLAYFNENQQLLALYWGLACAYQATVQYSQRTVVEEGTQTAAEDTVAEIGTQTITTTVIAPVVKKKQWTRRSTGPYHQLVREEEEEEERFDQEAGPSAKKWEEGVREIRQEAETTWSLTSSKLRDIQKDYSCQPGKWTTTDEGIQYLRELAVLEVIHSDLDEEEVSKDPEDVLCMQATWRKTWLELQYELESKAAKWYATMDIANAFFSIPLAAECRPQFAFTWRGVQYTWNQLPQGWKHSPTICHGLIQTALEKSDAPEHLQYIDDIIMWGNKAEEVFEKGKRVIQILLKAGFMIKKSKVKGPAQEIQFLGIKWQDGHHHVPMDVVNKIATMSPPANKKETQAFLALVGFWGMHIPGYSQLVSRLYQVTRKKNYFEWGLEQQQAFEQIKQEIAHAVALGPVWTGPAVQNVLYTASREKGLTCSLWQKTAGETPCRPLGFWSWGYRGSEAHYTPTEKEILAAYEGIRAASEVVGTEKSLLLAPRLPVLHWMFKGNIPSTHHATSATWSKWVALITQPSRLGKPNHPGILEEVMDWPEGRDFGALPEEVARAQEAPPYNELPEDERHYALFTDGSCHVVGNHRKWKAAVWSPTRQVVEATEGEGESSQFAEVKAIQLALDIAEREKWPVLYTESWMVANALWGWLQQWKKTNWQHRGKPIWAAALWQDIAARVENMAVKVRHVDAHIPKSRATEEHQNNEQVDKAAKIEVAQVDLDWERKVKDDDEPGPSPEQEEEPEPEAITQSLSLSELRDMRKDFSRLPGEHIITWLLCCWDNRASSLELEGREAKQLGSLSREGGIDKAIGKKAQALSLWRRLLSSVRERYPFSEDVICWPGKWSTMERGIQYLRELSVQEMMVYDDPDNVQLPTDPDEVQCTRPMW